MHQFPFQLPLLLDGSTGVMLATAGMPEGVCTEAWALAHPEVIKEIQRGYVRAGSRAVYAPTFCANRVKLAGYGLADRVTEMNRSLVALSREAVGKDVLIGGDMTSLGLFLKPFGDVSFDEVVAVYEEQAAALESAGVDFFIPETLMSLAEARAAVVAIRNVSRKPIFVTVTCDAYGRMLSGTTATAALVTLQAMGVAAFGLNCSVGPEAMLPVVRDMSHYAAIPLIVKPNAGLPEIVDGRTVFLLSPENFAAHTDAFAACGVSVFGGCCGTDCRHIEALARALETVTPAQPSEDAGQYICTSEREIFSLEETLEFGARIDASVYLADDLIDADESNDGGVWVYIADAEGLEAFAESQYMIKKPLRLSAESPELLLEAFRVYQGRAICTKEDWFSELSAYGAINIG